MGPQCSSRNSRGQRTELLAELYSQIQRNASMHVGWHIAGTSILEDARARAGLTHGLGRARPWRVMTEIHALDADHSSFGAELAALARYPHARQHCKLLTLLVWRRPIDFYASTYIYQVLSKGWSPNALTRACDTQVAAGLPFEAWARRAGPNAQSALLLYNEQFLGSIPRLLQQSQGAGWLNEVLARVDGMSIVAPLHRFDEFLPYLCWTLALPRCPGYVATNRANLAAFVAASQRASSTLADSKVPNCAMHAAALQPEAQLHAMNRSMTLISEIAAVDTTVLNRVESRFEAQLADARARPHSGTMGYEHVAHEFQRSQAHPKMAEELARAETHEWLYFELLPGETISRCSASHVRAIGGKLRNGTGRVLVKRGGVHSCRDAWIRRMHSKTARSAMFYD
jgi:hypothetical protein